MFQAANRRQFLANSLGAVAMTIGSGSFPASRRTQYISRESDAIRLSIRPSSGLGRNRSALSSSGVATSANKDSDLGNYLMAAERLGCQGIELDSSILATSGSLERARSVEDGPQQLGNDEIDQTATLLRESDLVAWNFRSADLGTMARTRENFLDLLPTFLDRARRALALGIAGMSVNVAARTGSRLVRRELESTALTQFVRSLSEDDGIKRILQEREDGDAPFTVLISNSVGLSVDPAWLRDQVDLGNELISESLGDVDSKMNFGCYVNFASSQYPAVQTAEVLGERIGGLGLDVYSIYPLKAEQPLDQELYPNDIVDIREALVAVNESGSESMLTVRYLGPTAEDELHSGETQVSYSLDKKLSEAMDALRIGGSDQ